MKARLVNLTLALAAFAAIVAPIAEAGGKLP